MLKILRHKKTAKKIWIGLALIIVPAFTLWGFGGAFRSREENKPLGRIFGRNVTDLEFKDSISAVTTAAIMKFGDKLPEIQQYLDLDSQAWDRLILLNETKRLRIKVSDKEVIGLIESYPFFQYKGNFDSKTYNQVLRYVFHLQPRAFEEQTRQSLMLNKLYKQVTGGLTVSDEEAALAFDKANQEISIYYIVSSSADFIKDIKPTESELKDYFEKNKELFRQPVSTEKDNKEAAIPGFKTVKQKVKEIFVNAQAQKLAEQKINLCSEGLKNRSFEQVAKENGLKAKETPPFKFGAQIPELASSVIFWEAAKSLKPGENSKVIKLASGFYIIKTKSLSSRDQKKFEKEKGLYTQKALEQKQEEKFSQFMGELKNKAR